MSTLSSRVARDLVRILFPDAARTPEREARLAEYRAFLAAKTAIAEAGGFDCEPGEVNPLLKPHQRDMVVWAVTGGRRAIFAAFGLGKSIVQLEVLRLVRLRAGGRALIVCPLGVRDEFAKDARFLATGVREGVTDSQREELAAWRAAYPIERQAFVPTFVRTDAEVEASGVAALFLTNYESVRDGRLDPRRFAVVSLDEASVLRGFGGTKTFRELMALFEGSGVHRFVATATPTPNEFVELLAYAAFLDVMDVGQAKTRFFKRDSSHADRLTIHPHKEREFWLWVASWALFVTRPSDLGHSDEGYELPPLDVRWHEIASEPIAEDIVAPNGQMRMFADASLGVVEASREKRRSLDARLAKMMEIRAEEPGEHRIVWHDLEDEREAIERLVPGVASVYGRQDLEERERLVRAFSDGEIPEIAAKPMMLGSGTNLQRHCARAIFAGIGHKFNDFIQAVHRLQRFQQTRAVRIDCVHTEAERPIKEDLLRKWEQHARAQATMAGIVREFGLASAALAGGLGRTMGVEEREASGEDWLLLNADCVEAAMRMATASVGHVVTSIPFSSQYEYTPSYNDFGHTDDNAHFWAQMAFLIPELLRVLQPGRICAVHVKDRITPGGINGLGFQTVTPFSDECVREFTRHGFAFLARKTIVTDVVRENAQTYRLGWSEQCKDGSRMGAGLPEYLLVFRAPQTDRSKGYADLPVVKDKGEYTRARWQLDASGFLRASGDRLAAPGDFEGLDHKRVYRRWKEAVLEEVYGFEAHVAIMEALDGRGMLPPSFSIVPCHSWHPDVWSDVMRARTLNTDAQRARRESHLCPLQFDIVDRAIVQYSNPGDVVFDPFSGVGTVVSRARKFGRVGVGTELNPVYWDGSTALARSQGSAAQVPSLFDLLAESEGEETDDLPAEVAAMPSLPPPAEDPPEWRLHQESIPEVVAQVEEPEPVAAIAADLIAAIPTDAILVLPEGFEVETIAPEPAPETTIGIPEAALYPLVYRFESGSSFVEIVAERSKSTWLASLHILVADEFEQSEPLAMSGGFKTAADALGTVRGRAMERLRVHAAGVHGSFPPPKGAEPDDATALYWQLGRQDWRSVPDEGFGTDLAQDEPPIAAPLEENGAEEVPAPTSAPIQTYSRLDSETLDWRTDGALARVRVREIAGGWAWCTEWSTGESGDVGVLSDRQVAPDRTEAIVRGRDELLATFAETVASGKAFSSRKAEHDRAAALYRSLQTCELPERETEVGTLELAA